MAVLETNYIDMFELFAVSQVIHFQPNVKVPLYPGSLQWEIPRIKTFQTDGLGRTDQSLGP
jgi:hypothetical protein